MGMTNTDDQVTDNLDSKIRQQDMAMKGKCY